MSTLATLGTSAMPKLFKNTLQFAKSSERLASGKRLSKAADGAGELAVANRIRSSQNITQGLVASREMAKGYLEIQNAAIDNISLSVNRIRELAISAQDPLKTTNDLNLIDTEVQAHITAAKTTTSATAKYNGSSVFGGTLNFAYGADVTNETISLGVTLEAGILTALTGDATSGANAATLSALVDGSGDATANALTAVAKAQADIAVNSNLVDLVSNIQQSNLASLAAQESAMRDIDYASESAALMKEQIAISAAQSIIAQGNSLQQGSLKFLG